MTIKTENQPLVTVGIPCYNASRFLGLAIKSVLAQTYSNFELIITDDGSSDSSVEIAKSFDDPRIIVISDGENHGISHRLNQQITLAKGEYFVRMDADDVMMPDRIERQINYLIDHPDVDVIWGNAIIIDDNNSIIGRRGSHNTNSYRFTIDNWAKGETLAHPTVAGKLKPFKEHLYSNVFKGVEDVHLWLRMCKTHNITYIPDDVLFYRDPLELKLKTYNFRVKQYWRLLLTPDVISEFGRYFSFKNLIKSHIKVLIMNLAFLFGLENRIIRRRNYSINMETKSYSSILEDLNNSK